MRHVKALAALALVVGSVLGCSTTSVGSANDASTGMAMPDSYPHAGIYDMITLSGEPLPVTDSVETGQQLVTERTWMRLTPYGTVEWFQYGELRDGTETYRYRMEHDGEWVRGSRPNSGSIIWGRAEVYLDDQLAEAGDMPDSDEYMLTAEGLQFLTTKSVYRRR